MGIVGSSFFCDEQSEQLAAQPLQHGLPPGTASIAASRLDVERCASRHVAHLRLFDRSNRQKNMDDDVPFSGRHSTLDFRFNWIEWRSERHGLGAAELRATWFGKACLLSI